MNALEIKLQKLNATLLGRFHETQNEVELLLTQYSKNFPTYTDHSIKHTNEVFNLASQLLTTIEIDNLNAEEIYILAMGCILHDIGMCIPENHLEDALATSRYDSYRASNPNKNKEELIRDIHHELSYDFILKEFKLLKIPDEKFAKAIALVAQGHRKVALDDINIYTPKYFVKNGREFVCLPYLSAILRIADEFDITNARTPALLVKYYLPESEKSLEEWSKHMATSLINFDIDKVVFEVKCSDHKILSALDDQFEKIQNVLEYCQKIIHQISHTGGRNFALSLYRIEPKYEYVNFDPKGIKFSFDVQNVVNTFIGEDLYENSLVAIRESIQNAIDSCRYRYSLSHENYQPKIEIRIQEDMISISDNGQGMDEFIIKNFFSKLGSSFYNQTKVKENYDAIGQFGIGVFSYFLLAEYIDIETKTSTDPALKFRFDKDPRSYFHFFSDPKRTSPGTTVVLNLKEQIKGKFEFHHYVDYIKSTFLYIEFPILITGKETIEIKKNSFEIELKSKLEKHLHIHKIEELELISALTIKVDSSSLEGSCSLLYHDIKNSQLFMNLDDVIDPDSFDNDYDGMYSEISFSQKGVFVQKGSIPYLNFVVGKINFKIGEKIHLSRGSFKDVQKINQQLNQFSFGLIDQLFELIASKIEIDQLPFYHTGLLNQYIVVNSLSQSSFKQEFIDLFQEKFYLRYYLNKIVYNLPISQLLSTHSQFLIVFEQEIDAYLTTIKDIPIVVLIVEEFSYNRFSSFRDLFSLLFDFNIKIVLINDRYYVKISYDKTENKTLIDFLKSIDFFHTKHLVEFEGFNLIGANTCINKPILEDLTSFYNSDYFNINHAFFIFIVNNVEHINSKEDYRKIVRYVLTKLIDIMDDEIKTDIADDINKVIKPLEQIGFSHVFNESDFVS